VAQLKNEPTFEGENWNALAHTKTDGSMRAWAPGAQLKLFASVNPLSENSYRRW
jgi:hypothetical protein